MPTTSPWLSRASGISGTEVPPGRQEGWDP
jgi:hypothetical protein